MDNKHPDAAAIDRVGSALITKHFGISKQAVSYWRRKGVPRYYRMELAMLGNLFGKPLPEMLLMRDRDA